MTHQCMALNRDMTDRCPRRATKMLATSPGPSYQARGLATRDLAPPSIATVRLCGHCNRSLHSGSRSLCLHIDDGSRHTVTAGDRLGEIHCTKDRGEA